MRRRLPILTVAVLLALGAPLAADSARDLYTQALARERALRAPAGKTRPTLPQIRSVIDAYETLMRRYPSSGYSDNALWQAAGLAFEAFERFGQETDRKRGIRLLQTLRREYPSSSLVPRVPERMRAFDSTAGVAVEAKRAADKPARPAPTARASPTPPPPVAVAAEPAPPPAESPASEGPSVAPEPIAIRDIRRTRLPEAVRVTLELDAEVPYRQERLANPDRVFFDLQNTRAAPALAGATLAFTDDVVREIRLGRHPNETTRVVLDMANVARYSVFTLYNPYRLVIDCERAPPLTTVAISPEPELVPPAPAPAPPAPVKSSPVLPAAARTLPVPAVPSANAAGGFSLARQLGLSVSRIVIDPGHGGHDPGAQSAGLSEAELVLDVALRLEELLLKQPGIEVALTRRDDVFIPLEERTAIANREGADLFLSIHANASRNASARGVETYFLNFATNPEAEAVAARENSASGRTMHSLPDIVQAIALNNKLDESRDFAAMIQQAIVRKLRPANRNLRDLGVKQAPFVVLIGAGMPSVLAEISFVTSRAEGRLLKTKNYRQRIAEALRDAIVRYQRSLKNVPTVAKQ